jgi:serine/threonine-protein kinase
VLGRLGRYILVDRLGAGGMAEVFRALVLGPEQFQRVVVVKRILAQFAAKPAFVQMFIDEARLCGRLSHPNIIQVYEFGTQDRQYFITMEYADGRSLGHILQRLHDRRERLPPVIAAEILRQVCRGVAYAHGLCAEDGKPLQIIHRDLSPANLLVGYNGAVKVLDFGIARMENRFRSGVTDPGQVKGKSAYLAPEQITRAAVDHRADLFTLGIVMHEMLTGQRLFRAGTSSEDIQRVRAMPIAPPSRINPAVPVRLDAIVMRALRRQPEERYQNATDLADALESFLLEHRVSSQELPAFMRALYGSEIGRDQIHISREQIQALAAVPGPTSPQPPPPAPVAAISATPSGEPAIEVDAREEPARSFPRMRALLLAGGMALAGLAIAFGPRLSRTGWGMPATPPPLAAIRARPAPPPSAAAPAPATVTIAVASQPPGALVYDESGAALGQTPLNLVRPRGEQSIRLRLRKPSYLEGELEVVPDADKPAVGVLARSGERRARPRVQKVKNALPIDPFSP